MKIVRKLMILQPIGNYTQPKSKIKIGGRKRKVKISHIQLVSEATGDIQYDSDEASLLLTIPPDIEDIPSIKEINKLGDGWWKARKILKRKRTTDGTILTIEIEINVNRDSIEESECHDHIRSVHTSKLRKSLLQKKK